jgi:N,N-dimethylformamidase
MTTPDIAVVVSTNTWAAYNEFGGLSNYRDYASPQPLRLLKKVLKTMNWRLVVGNRRSVPALPLPFLRPNAAINEDLATLDADPVDYPSHLVRAEWAALRHFDRSDLSYGVYADSDIAFGGAPYKARLMIFTAHSEYWSEEMKGRFTSYLATGGRALFLSGNHWYRTVKFLEHGLEVVDDRVDPSVVAATLGSGYTADGYETYAPYRVVNADHPVFEGTGLAEGDHFAGPDDRGRGGSGYETDKVNMGSGLVDVLAVGDNVEGPAFMVWKEHPAGGWVCNFGSVASAPWLERCVFMASVVKNVVRLGVTEAP